MHDLNANLVQEFLKANFDKHTASVQFIGAGMFSQAFSFVADEKAFIFRVNAHREDFEKDQFAYRHFSSLWLPIPKMICIEPFDDSRYYAITEKCAGQTVNKLDADTVDRVVPRLFDTLAAIHRLDVSNYRGWGLTDAGGLGIFENWEEYLLSIYNHKFSYNWSRLAEHPFWERKIHETLFSEMQQLLPYCSTEKHFIHRDFGFDNVVSDGEKITGVLDWAELGLGDRVYDAAYLDFYSKNVPYGDLWYDYLISKGDNVSNFEERVRCYMLREGLDAMASAAVRNDKRDYIRCRERSKSVLLPGRRSVDDWTQ